MNNDLVLIHTLSHQWIDHVYML